MTYKLGLVQTSDIIGNNLVLPLAIGALWTFAKQHVDVQKSWQLCSVVYQHQSVEETAIMLSKNDMICFSTYIWNADFHLELAKEIKKHNANIKLVFGGPHFSDKWPDFWEQHKHIIDLVFLGEGEESFLQLLLKYPDWNEILQLPGAWSPTSFLGVCPRVNLDKYVSPYLDGFYDSIIKSSQLQGYTVQAVIQTNRGCPYHCTFCEQGKEYKNKLYSSDIQQTMQEIEWCGKNKIEYLTIADDNFGILNRDVDIMEKICMISKTYGYPKILDTTYAKNNPKNVFAIASLDKAYGTNLIKGITIAVQSNNVDTLRHIKRFNLHDVKMFDLVGQLKRIGVPIYAEMIWPLPFETIESLYMGIDQNINCGLDNWIAVYPLSMQTSADLFHDFGHQYQFAEQAIDISSVAKSHIKMNTPMSSDWADHEAVVEGHVFYMWLTALYFFGFSRPLIDLLKTQNELSASQIINSITRYIENSDKYPDLKLQHQTLKEFWKQWLTYQEPPEIGQFTGQDMNFWYPYTHHASWLQNNHELWLEFLDSWARENTNITACKIPDIIDKCRHAVVRFDQVYPYQCSQGTVSLLCDPPSFTDKFEFCRYYYWYNRKRGYSRTIIT